MGHAWVAWRLCLHGWIFWVWTQNVVNTSASSFITTGTFTLLQGAGIAFLALSDLLKVIKILHYYVLCINVPSLCIVPNLSCLLFVSISAIDLYDWSTPITDIIHSLSCPVSCRNQHWNPQHCVFEDEWMLPHGHIVWN